MDRQIPPDPVEIVRRRLSAALAGRYVIEGEVGWGGMALVFRARDLRHTRTVVLKVVRPELTTTQATRRFLDEIRIAARLQHPHIVPVYDSGEADGLVYFVMPFIEGETLRQRMDRDAPLPVAEALGIVRDVADALAHAHGRGIVHRDIKPENILLGSGHAQVADFGVAFAAGRDGSRVVTDPGQTVGTFAYMSPEQAGGRPEIDGRADLYSLACVLYEMLAGYPAWRDVQERLYGGAATRDLPRPTRDDIPTAVLEALARALAVQPAERFATIADFADALALSGVPRGSGIAT